MHHKGHFSSTFVHVHLDAANVHHVGIRHIVTNVHHVAYVTNAHGVVGAHCVIYVIHHIVGGVHQVNVHYVVFAFSMDGINPTLTLSYKLEFC